MWMQLRFVESEISLQNLELWLRHTCCCCCRCRRFLLLSGHRCCCCCIFYFQVSRPIANVAQQLSMKKFTFSSSVWDVATLDDVMPGPSRLLWLSLFLYPYPRPLLLRTALLHFPATLVTLVVVFGKSNVEWINTLPPCLRLKFFPIPLKKAEETQQQNKWVKKKEIYKK